MSFLSERERRTVKAVCEALVPALAEPSLGGLGLIRAEDLGLAEEVEAAFAALLGPQEAWQMRLFLRALGSPIVNGVLAGVWRPFAELPVAERTRVLRGWMESRWNMRRKAFQAVKRLALFLTYTLVPGDEGNPAWPVIGYSPPPAPDPSRPRPVSTLDLTDVQELTAEVLVIGSGAGGGVVAATLAEAGHDVLVVEKGGYFAPPDFDGFELAGNARLFEKRGALTTADLGTVVLAGSALGGGTVVNWSTSLAPPPRVLREWSVGYGFEGVEGGDYQRSLAAVQARMHVNRKESEPNSQNRMLARGAAGVGMEARLVPRNVAGCVDCTYCAFGCRYGAKQSTLETFLPAAQDAGARLAVEVEVERVLVEAGQAVGAEAVRQTPHGQQGLIIRSNAVVVCAGSVHTPALLLRSGLNNPNIGQHLRLHPVTAPLGLYEQPIRSWQGPPQTRMVNELADLDGRGHGVRIEVAPAHPGLWASALPWLSGEHHKWLMRHLDHLGNLIVITRDQGSGRVRLDGQGKPVLEYELSPADRAHLKEGMVQAVRMHRAAGARRILSPHTVPRVYRAASDDFSAFLHEVGEAPFGPNQIGLYSAHQMGTARIADTPARGAVRPDGATWEVENLYVADGSVFPTASGVNPMVPIAATAHFLSGRILAQLG